ncbi:MAG: hypothetical protein N3A62_10610 [Thermodesulfovibrionales bacterium]|nr:hypothetical protein [Thermodesulfovibrionales bacterium]
MAKRKSVEIDVDFLRLNGRMEVIQSGLIKNICDGGMCIETTFPLMIAQPVIVRYTNSHSVVKYGVVCWTKKVDNHYTAGVRLLIKEKEEGC